MEMSGLIAELFDIKRTKKTHIMDTCIQRHRRRPQRQMYDLQKTVKNQIQKTLKEEDGDLRPALGAGVIRIMIMNRDFKLIIMNNVISKTTTPTQIYPEYILNHLSNGMHPDYLWSSRILNTKMDGTVVSVNLKTIKSGRNEIIDVENEQYRHHQRQQEVGQKDIY